MNKTKFLVQSAMIAAIYVVLTLVFKPISYGLMQVRVSEALTILPFFTPAAIPGLAIGCLLANVIGPYGILDVILGTTATLIAAVLSYKMPNKYLVPIPPIIVNALIIGPMLYYILVAEQVPVQMMGAILWVALGQVIACYGLGYPLLRLLEKYKNKIFS